MMFSRPAFRVAALFATISLGIHAQAEIDYLVKVDPEQKRVLVTIKVPSGSGPVSVQSPNWMPGHYVLDYYYKGIHEVAATDLKGGTLPVEHPDENTWTVANPTGTVCFSYWVPIGYYRRFALPNDDSFVQVPGAVNLMYVVGRKPETCKIRYDLPKDWPALIGLDQTGKTPNTFTAPTYDVLIDNPLSTGDVIVDKYRLKGKDEYIVLEGASKDLVDRARLLKYCRSVSAMESDFFKGVPYHKYVWHFIVQPGGGGGGLEHLSSTQISFGASLTPSTENLLAHEHFHLWNVKRIRAKVLGPFDYLKLPQTGSLWWSEGVTDYYASLLPYRYGDDPQEQFFNTIGSNYSQLKSNPARLEVSPYQSSFRLGDAAGARGSSGANGGYRISFYNLGFLSGLCLDLEIRCQSKGKASLDDVMRALFEECKNDQPGFEEDEIRKQCIRFGGPGLGDFYDKIVMSPGEMPIPDQLAKMGLIIGQAPKEVGGLGFTAVFDPSGAATVRTVSSSTQDRLTVGDKIIAVDGKTASTEDPHFLSNLIIDYAFAGHLDPISLTVRRGDQTLDISLLPTRRTVNRWVISPDPNASKDAISLREEWLRVLKPSLR